MEKQGLVYNKEIKVRKDITLGYIYFMDKTHPLANKTYGKVYYHRHVASISLGRWLLKEEMVHHKDGDKENNHPNNLEIMTEAEHMRHHAKERGFGTERVDCPICKTLFTVNKSVLKKGSGKYCSSPCSNIGQRRVIRPSKEDLKNSIKNLSWLAMGRKYGVSDNAVRKWARRYGLI